MNGQCPCQEEEQVGKPAYKLKVKVGYKYHETCFSQDVRERAREDEQEQAGNLSV